MELPCNQIIAQLTIYPPKNWKHISTPCSHIFIALCIMITDKRETKQVSTDEWISQIQYNQKLSIIGNEWSTIISYNRGSQTYFGLQLPFRGWWGKIMHCPPGKILCNLSKQTDIQPPTPITSEVLVIPRFFQYFPGVPPSTLHWHEMYKVVQI